MATAFASVPHAEDRSVLREITWETYVRLCDENQRRSAQMSYFEGDLEIMTVGLLHELARGRIRSMIDAVAGSLEIDLWNTGQYTFRHESKKIGFEADLTYYATGLAAMRRKTKLDLAKDPPPDLVVEVDVSRNSERKLSMYAALGIPEVWRCEGMKIRIYRLSVRDYKTAAKSSILRGTGARMLTQLLADGARMTLPEWLKHVRQSAAAR